MDTLVWLEEKNQRNKQKLNIFLNISNIVYAVKVTFTLNSSILTHTGMKFQVNLFSQVSLHRLPWERGPSSPSSLCLPQPTPSRTMQIKQTPLLTLSFEPNSVKMNWESCFNRPTGIPAENLGRVVTGRDAQCSTSTAWLCLPAQHWAGAVQSLPLHTAQQLCTNHLQLSQEKHIPSFQYKGVHLCLARQFLNIMIWADCGQQSWGKSSKDKQELADI